MDIGDCGYWALWILGTVEIGTVGIGDWILGTVDVGNCGYSGLWAFGTVGIRAFWYVIPTINYHLLILWVFGTVGIRDCGHSGL